MKHALALAAVLLFAAAPVFAEDAAPPARNPLCDSVVRIVTQSHPAGMRYVNGSGIVTDRGILTAWHVVDDATSVWVLGPDGRMIAATRVRRVGIQDAAQITLAEPHKWKALPVAQAELSGGAVRGACIGHWGFGANDGRCSESRGWVYPDAPLVRGLPPGRWYQTSIALGPGFSGSGLIVNGKVVGIAALSVRAPGGVNLTCFARVIASELPVVAPPPPPPEKPDEGCPGGT